MLNPGSPLTMPNHFTDLSYLDNMADGGYIYIVVSFPRNLIQPKGGRTGFDGDMEADSCMPRSCQASLNRQENTQTPITITR